MRARKALRSPWSVLEAREPASQAPDDTLAAAHPTGDGSFSAACESSRATTSSRCSAASTARSACW